MMTELPIAEGLLAELTAMIDRLVVFGEPLAPVDDVAEGEAVRGRRGHGRRHLGFGLLDDAVVHARSHEIDPEGTSVSVVFPTLADLLKNRQIEPREGGGYAEDSYDFGIHWLDSRGGRYRLTWIGPRGRGPKSGDPGELYLYRLHDGPAELLCIIPPDDRADGNVAAILTGWGEVCGEPNSVDWIRDRVYEALRAGWAHPVGARSCYPHDHQEGT